MNYIKISTFDTANGKGIGSVLWVAGCDHHCKECHNPDTWNPKVGEPFTEDTLETLLKTLEPPYIKRLTLSGGDPLYIDNRPCIEKILKSVKTKYPKKKVWLYTGYKYEDVEMLPYVTKYVDVLVDGEFQIDKKDISLPYCGSSNQRVIDVKETVNEGIVTLYL